MRAWGESREGHVELTDERFLDAVIRVHERISTGLRAIASGERYIEDRIAPEDDEIIRGYCTLHGVALTRPARAASVPAPAARCVRQ